MGSKSALSAAMTAPARLQQAPHMVQGKVFMGLSVWGVG